jgi:hypothetical protein
VKPIESIKKTWRKVRELAGHDSDTLKKMILNDTLPKGYGLPFLILVAITLIVVVFFVVS